MHRIAIVVGLAVAGCGAIVEGDDDADGETAETEQLDTEPDAADDAADAYDRGEADTGDEDDGWTDPAGEDGGDEAEAPRAVCNEDCGIFGTGNGYCEDGGPGSVASNCRVGNDCADCGTRYVYPDGDVAP